MSSRPASRLNRAAAPWLNREAAGLFAAALAVRVLLAAATGKLVGYAGDWRYDDGIYIDMARAFLGSGEAVITHPPGYPLFLSPFMLLGEPGITLARWAQLLLGAWAAPLTRRLSQALGVEPAAALAAGALVAVNPMLAYFCCRMLSETVFSVLVLCFFLLWLRAWEGGAARSAVQAGLIGGLASLVRGSFLPFGAFLAAAAFWRRREQPRWLGLVAACGMAWGLVISVWTARNYLRFGRFVPISAQGGWNLYEGMSMDPAELELRPLDMGREAEARGLKDVFETDAYFGRKAKAWIRENPGEFVWLTARKALKFWRLFPAPPHPPPVRWAAGLYTLAVFALAALGLWRGAGAGRGFPFVLAWALCLTALHAVFASNLRYRLPLEPFVAVAAGTGLAGLLRQMGILHSQNELQSKKYGV